MTEPWEIMRWKLYGKVYACVLCGYHWERHCQIYFSLKNKNFSSVSWNYNVSYLCDVYFPPTRSKHIKIISVSYISSGDFEMALLFVTTWKTEQHTYVHWQRIFFRILQWQLGSTWQHLYERSKCGKLF